MLPAYGTQHTGLLVSFIKVASRMWRIANVASCKMWLKHKNVAACTQYLLIPDREKNHTSVHWKWSSRHLYKYDADVMVVVTGLLFWRWIYIFWHDKTTETRVWRTCTEERWSIYGQKDIKAGTARKEGASGVSLRQEHMQTHHA